MMDKRISEVERKTSETQISLRINLDGVGQHSVATGIGFFDHMLTLFAVHGFFDLRVDARGDLDVDFHHTVEDIGLVLGEAIDKALGDRKGIKRYGHIVTPMDDALAAVSIDLSNRPYLVYNLPAIPSTNTAFDQLLAKEFFRALAAKGGLNLHINVRYGENDHHILESIFKAFGRALSEAAALDDRVAGIRSSKGLL